MNETTYKVFNNNIKLIYKIKYIIEALRKQNYRMALDEMSIFASELNQYITEIAGNIDYYNKHNPIITLEYILNVLKNILNIQEKKDYVLLADLYELDLLPIITAIQSVILSENEVYNDSQIYERNMQKLSKADNELYLHIKNTDICFDNFGIEYTITGEKTVYVKDGEYYLHSLGYPGEEAKIFARDNYSDEEDTYTVLGLGFGYHIRALINEDRGIRVRVFETNLNLIKLALTYIDFSDLISNENFELIYDENLCKISKYLDKSKLVIFRPALKYIKNQDIVKRFEEYLIVENSLKISKRVMKDNFKNNVINCLKTADELKKRINGKEIYIIAGGPSLNHSLYILSDIDRKKSVIIAAGAVFRKLLSNKIIPDFIIFTDPTDKIYEQIRGLETNNISMIVLSTANKNLAINYKGEKYIAYQKRFNKAEEYALKNNLTLFETGGSVVTLAIDMAIRFRAECIKCLGLDLSYADGNTHAEGVAGNEVKLKDENLIPVLGMNGKTVYTNSGFELMRKWIEKRIANEKDIRFINISDTGVIIEGMENREKI